MAFSTVCTFAIENIGVRLHDNSQLQQLAQTQINVNLFSKIIFTLYFSMPTQHSNINKTLNRYLRRENAPGEILK